MAVEEVGKSTDTRSTVDFAVIGDTVVFICCVDFWLEVVEMDSVIETLELLEVDVVAAIAHDV